MKDELKVIKEQFDQHVFSKHPYQSQKEEILKRLQKKPKKHKRVIHTLAAVAAVALFTIITSSYVLQQGKENPGQQAEDPTPPTNQNPITDKNEDKTIEETTPPQQEKTGEEWIAQFKDEWDRIREPFQKMQLTYHSNTYDSQTIKRTYEINMEYTNENLTYVADSFIDRPKNSQHLKTIIQGNKLTQVDHILKNFETSDLTGTAVDIFNNPSDLTLEPLFPLNGYETLFSDAYSWDVEKVDEAAGWVQLLATVNPDYSDYTRTKAKVKINLDTSIVLELITYEGEKVFEELLVEKALVDDEVVSLNLDTTVPNGYVDINKVNKERVKIDSQWETETNQALKGDPQVSEEGFLLSGEGGFVSFILTVKEGTSEQNAKQLAQSLVNIYTEKANASTELKQRGISIWDQYAFNIFIIIEPTQDDPTYNGDMSKDKQNGVPLIKWNN
ncbi:hypothetical protein [Bacillus nitroreducens]